MEFIEVLGRGNGNDSNSILELVILLSCFFCQFFFLTKKKHNHRISLRKIFSGNKPISPIISLATENNDMFSREVIIFMNYSIDLPTGILHQVFRKYPFSLGMAFQCFHLFGSNHSERKPEYIYKI